MRYSYSAVALIAQLAPAFAGPIAKAAEPGLLPRQVSDSAQVPAPTNSFPLGNVTAPLPTGTGTGTIPVTVTPTLSESSSVSANSTSSSAESTSPAEPTEAPPFNLMNATCEGITNLHSDQQWEAVDGDTMVTRFEDMLADNLLVCPDCFGMTAEECQSEDPGCQNGIADLAKRGGDVARWDTAAAIFAQNVDITDLNCNLGTTSCSGAPTCDSCNGPGSWAMLKSLTTMHNLYQNIYDSIQQAGVLAIPQMTPFQETFAPVPDTSDDSLFFNLMLNTVAGIAGFIPGIGAAWGGLITGIGNGVAREMFNRDLPKPTDPASYLGFIINNTQSVYEDFTNNIFERGEYELTSADGFDQNVVRLADLMSDGASMRADPDRTQFFNALVDSYVTILYQQLAYYTWSNLQSDDQGHVPFIAFDNMPCDQVNPDDENTVVNSILQGAHELDVSITYNDTCYYLLDGVPKGETVPGGLVAGYIENCGFDALPGGTHEALRDSASTFHLTLEDFIVPSIEGWAANGKQNGYPIAAQDGKLVSGPRAPGAINIPVCDYLGDPEGPGMDCPRIGSRAEDSSCPVFEPNTEQNDPGEYQSGWCTLHLQQFQRREMNNNLNPLDWYQIEVTVFDDFQREVARATKQSAQHPLELVDTSLPYNLVIAMGENDEAPVSFWYSDQFWDSNSEANHCSVGGYDSGSRQMDCGFQCPAPRPEPPVSATEGHALPAAPTRAIGGAVSLIDTYQTAPPEPTPTPEGPPPEPDYATGWCGMHVKQYQKWDDDSNPTGDYQIEVTIYDAEQNAIGSSGKIPAPDSRQVEIPGLISPLTIQSGLVDSDPMTVRFNGQEFSTYTDQCSPEDRQKYDNGARGLDCGFTC